MEELVALVVLCVQAILTEVQMEVSIYVPVKFGTATRLEMVQKSSICPLVN